MQQNFLVFGDFFRTSLKHVTVVTPGKQGIFWPSRLFALEIELEITIGLFVPATQLSSQHHA